MVSVPTLHPKTAYAVGFYSCAALRLQIAPLPDPVSAAATGCHDVKSGKSAARGGLEMKKLAAMVVLGVLSVGLVAASGQARSTAQSRASQKADRKQQKATKKYLKAQQKAQRKMIEKDRKNTHLPTNRY